VLLLRKRHLRTRRLAPRLAWHSGRAWARPHHDATKSRSLRRLLGERFCSRHLVRYAACGPESSEIKRTNQVQLQAKIAVNEWLQLTARSVARPAESRWPTAPPPSSGCGEPQRARSPQPFRARARARRG